VSEGVSYAKRLQGGRTDLPDAFITRIIKLAREQHGPLNPRLTKDLQGRWLVVGDRGEHGLTADRHAVEGVFLPDQEFLQQSRRVCMGRNRLQPPAKRRDII